MQGADGNFYGPTSLRAGQTKDFEGTIFQITPAGVEKVIHRFTPRVGSNQPLISYNGSLVGISAGSGHHRYGKVFALREARDGQWAVSDWYSFSSSTTGSSPEAPLIEGSDGNL